MRDRHWRVAVGHPSGAAYAVSEYSSPELAVYDFLNLTNSIYPTKSVSRADVDQLIEQYADEDRDFCLAVGVDQPLLVVYGTCYCQVSVKSN